MGRPGQRTLGFSRVKGLNRSWKLSAMICRHTRMTSSALLAMPSLARQDEAVDSGAVRTYHSLKDVFTLLVAGSASLAALFAGCCFGSHCECRDTKLVLWQRLLWEGLVMRQTAAGASHELPAWCCESTSVTALHQKIPPRGSSGARPAPHSGHACTPSSVIMSYCHSVGHEDGGTLH